MKIISSPYNNRQVEAVAKEFRGLNDNGNQQILKKADIK
jgi:hypothetical protein